MYFITNLFGCEIKDALKKNKHLVKFSLKHLSRQVSQLAQLAWRKVINNLYFSWAKADDTDDRRKCEDDKSNYYKYT